MNLERIAPIKPNKSENEFLRCTILREINARLNNQILLTHNEKENKNKIPAIINEDFITKIQTDWHTKFNNNRCIELVTMVKIHNLAKKLMSSNENCVISNKLSTHNYLVLYRADTSGSSKRAKKKKYSYY